MSNRMSDETTAAFMAMAFIAITVIFFFVAVAVVAAFVCIPLSIIAWFALERDVHIMGKTFTPEWADAFVTRGGIGAALVPLFLAFCLVFFSPWMEPVDWGAIWWPLLILGGYVAGSVGGEAVIWDKKRRKREEDVLQGIFTPMVPPQPKSVDPPSAPEPVIYSAPQPFEFASWDDEERMS